MISKAKPGSEVQLIAAGGGKFEIRVDGRLAFSKIATGRFPSDKEILASMG